MTKKRIIVIFGGQSTEHDVSRVSATSIINNIDTQKYDISIIGITKAGKWLCYEGDVAKIATGEWEQFAKEEQLNMLDLHKRCDVVFPVIHGCNGEDGTIQGLFELLGIPYVGCGILASAVGMDKAYTKIVFEKANIPQVRYICINRKEINKDMDKTVCKIEADFKYPCFIKPSNSGSSVGVSKARNRLELENALIFAAKYDRRVLVEDFINGRELECSVLGNDAPIASLVGEVLPCNEFYDYNAKYIDNSSKTVVPADISQNVADRIREYAVKAFMALDCAGLSRVDFFLDNDTGEIYLNEINTMPGFTDISMYPKMWEATGVPYKELVERLIDLAFERFEENKRECGL